MSKISLLLLVPLALLTCLCSYFWSDLALLDSIGQTKPQVLQLKTFIVTNPDLKTPLSLACTLTMLLLFAIQVQVFLKNYNPKKLLGLALATTLIFSLSYPLTSHDIFSYLFASRMKLVYNLDPYTVKPETIQDRDLYISFTHWRHNLYQYPIFSLAYNTGLMKLVGPDRIILNYYILKLANWLLYFIAGYALLKTLYKPKLVFALWFFNPLLVWEWLVNGHNEVLMLSLATLSCCLFLSKKNIASIFIWISSVLTKYISLISLPVAYFYHKKQYHFAKIVLLLFGVLFIFKSKDLQIWYFSWIYLLLPFSNLKNKSILLIFFHGLLSILSYLPFLQTGRWTVSYPILSNIPLYTAITILSILILETAKGKRTHRFARIIYDRSN